MHPKINKLNSINSTEFGYYDIYWFEDQPRAGALAAVSQWRSTRHRYSRKSKSTMGDNGDYYGTEYGLCPSWALSLGYMGVASGAVLSNWGSAVSSLD